MKLLKRSNADFNPMKINRKYGRGIIKLFYDNPAGPNVFGLTEEEINTPAICSSTGIYFDIIYPGNPGFFGGRIDIDNFSKTVYPSTFELKYMEVILLNKQEVKSEFAIVGRLSYNGGEETINLPIFWDFCGRFKVSKNSPLELSARTLPEMK